MDGANGASGRVRSLVTHHPHGHHRQQHGKRLPDLRVEAGAPDLIDHDIIGFLEDGDALWRDLSQDADRQTWSWKWLALDNFLWHIKFPPNAPNFVLKQIL